MLGAMLARTPLRLPLVLLVAALASSGCRANHPAESAESAATDEDYGEDATTDDEAAAMASIEEYLAGEEGEDDDAGEAPAAAPQGTTVERRDELWALVKAKRPVVAECYKTARKGDPNLGTKIAVRILLKPDGSLKSDPEIVPEMSDISHPDVTRCAIDAVKGIEYPPHPKGMETTFTYPFGF